MSSKIFSPVSIQIPDQRLGMGEGGGTNAKVHRYSYARESRVLSKTKESAQRRSRRVRDAETVRLHVCMKASQVFTGQPISRIFLSSLWHFYGFFSALYTPGQSGNGAHSRAWLGTSFCSRGSAVRLNAPSPLLPLCDVGIF